MKQTVYFDDFRQAFQQSGRENQFSYEGLETLFEMLEEYEEDTGEELELDVIALCCDFTEYESLEELISAYDCIETEDDIADHTWYRQTESNGYIIQNF
jgi:hypothetical protein